jgi:hypothetical protein
MMPSIQEKLHRIFKVESQSQLNIFIGSHERTAGMFVEDLL